MVETILRGGKATAEGRLSPYHSVKLASLVALGLALLVFALSGAKLTEIFSSLGSNMREQLHFDTAKGLA